MRPMIDRSPKYMHLYQAVKYDHDKICLTAKTGDAAEHAFQKGLIENLVWTRYIQR